MAFAPTGSQFRSLGGGWQPSGVPITASLTTALAGNNNDLKFTHKIHGANHTGGNAVTVAYIDPPGNNAALAVSVTGNAISVSLATDGASAVTSTAAQVRDAINAHVDASRLVVAANAAGNDGTGVVTALAATALTGGVGYTLSRGGGSFTRVGPRGTNANG